MACLGAFTQERQGLWLPKDDLKDASEWSSTPLVILRDIHNQLLAKYDCKDSVPPPALPGMRRTSSEEGNTFPRTVYLRRRRRIVLSFFHKQAGTLLLSRLVLSFFRNSTTWYIRQICGERTLPMMVPPFLLNTVSHTRFLITGRPFWTSNVRLWSHVFKHVVLNSYVSVHIRS